MDLAGDIVVKRTFNALQVPCSNGPRIDELYIQLKRLEKEEKIKINASKSKAGILHKPVKCVLKKKKVK